MLTLGSYFLRDLLIKFTKESNHVETLSDDLITLGSSHIESDALTTKTIIDVESDELTPKNQLIWTILTLCWTMKKLSLTLKDILDLWFQKRRRSH